MNFLSKTAGALVPDNGQVFGLLLEVGGRLGEGWVGGGGCFESIPVNCRQYVISPRASRFVLFDTLTFAAMASIAFHLRALFQARHRRFRPTGRD